MRNAVYSLQSNSSQTITNQAAKISRIIPLTQYYNSCYVSITTVILSFVICHL
ncbi:MAG: hypothetical protein F6K31_24540 [Symploca sp. SIO2G7]|nr:hypothetical protein [Symploca sp. SIO2G7]